MQRNNIGFLPCVIPFCLYSQL